MIVAIVLTKSSHSIFNFNLISIDPIPARHNKTLTRRCQSGELYFDVVGKNQMVDLLMYERAVLF